MMKVWLSKKKKIKEDLYLFQWKKTLTRFIRRTSITANLNPTNSTFYIQINICHIKDTQSQNSSNYTVILLSSSFVYYHSNILGLPASHLMIPKSLTVCLVHSKIRTEWTEASDMCSFYQDR